MKANSGLPVVESEPQSKTIPLTELNALTDSASIPPVDQSELDTTTAGSLLVDKGELLTEPTPAEPITASSPLVEISEPQEQTVEHDTPDVQVTQKSASSQKVDGSRPPETTAISSPLVGESELLAEMRGSAAEGITTSEVIESDNPLLEPTSASSPAIEQSELLSELQPDNSSPVAQSELISASKTPATKRTSKPRSKSISEPARRKTRRRAK